MKHLRDVLYEGILDIDDNAKKEPNFKGVIEKFLENNYEGASTCKIRKDLNPNGKYVVDSVGSMEVKNRSIDSLTNGLFVFGEIKKDFNCSYCISLTSLEGAPEKVGGDFNCVDCDLLTTLIGSPKIIKGYFSCVRCNSLTSLEGAPKYIHGEFLKPDHLE